MKFPRPFPVFQSNRAAIFLFAVMVVLLGIGIWAAIHSEDAVGRSISELTANRRRVGDLRALLSSLNEMQSGKRGFVITGEAPYLESYDRGALEADRLIESLDTWLAQAPEKKESWNRVQNLIEHKRQALAEVILLRRMKGFEAATQAIANAHGKHLMDEIRNEIGEILDAVELDAANADVAARKSLHQNTQAITWLSLAAVAMSLGAFVTLLNVFRAKEETEEMEIEKVQAERADQEKSKFLASMSHEIRTPLNAMLGFGELLEEEVETERGRKYIHAIRASGDGLLNLINDILDLSKIEAGALELDEEPVVVQDFANDIRLLFSQKAMESGLDFEVETSTNCPDYLVFDPLRVRQILTNLTANAFKFTDEGSIKVRFDAHPVADREDIIDLAISVSDTGRGIPDEKLKDIFSPFRQVESEDEARGGTGLGLSICTSLADLMNGELSVQSQWGKGSVFTLKIPEVEISTDIVDAVEEAALGNDLDIFTPSKILVVDDNPFNRDLVAAYLKGTHHTVRFASNGREGVEQVEREKPDVILMDIRMPVMDGREAFKRIKEEDENAELPILAVTASSLLQEEKRLRRQFDGYLRKPFSRAQLVRVLDPVLPKTNGNTAPRSHWLRNTSDLRMGNPETLPELIDRLKTLSEERVPNLLAAMAMGEIAEFGADLGKMGTEYQSDLVTRYAQNLKSQAELFEMSIVEQQLDEFSALATELESFLKTTQNKPNQ